jgi:chromosome segregation ATPase
MRVRLGLAEEEIGRVAAQAAIELGEARREAVQAAARMRELEGKLDTQRYRPPAPVADLASSAEVKRLQLQLAEREAELGRLVAERQEAVWKAEELSGKLMLATEELGNVQLRYAPVDVITKAAEHHEAEIRDLRAQLDERDAYADELRAELAEANAAQERIINEAAQVFARAETSERELRELRGRLSRAEGELLRRNLSPDAAPPAAPAPAVAPAAEPTGGGQVAALEGELAEKQKLLDKANQRWKEAESKSDELWRKIGEMQREMEKMREEGVEKARMQRHAAQVALTRAMEEAAKKLVSVQDDKMRADKEIAELTRVREALTVELTQARQAVTELAAARDRALSELDAADHHAAERVERAHQEVIAVRAQAASEIATLRDELQRPRGEEASARLESVESALRGLDEELKGEEQRLAELEGQIRAAVTAGGAVDRIVEAIQRTRSELHGRPYDAVPLLDQLVAEVSSITGSRA